MTNFNGNSRSGSGLRFREEIGVPNRDLGRAYQYTRSKISDPTDSLDDVNIPEIREPRGEFSYNYYTKDERTTPFSTEKNLSIDKFPRYVTLSWTSPTLSDFETQKPIDSGENFNPDFSIEKNADKILSEDNFFNSGFVNHTFSDVSVIEQGASDIENYSRLSHHDVESVFKMTRMQIKELSSDSDSTDEDFNKELRRVSDDYMTLADFPKTSLGLRVYDEQNKLNDEDDLIRSLSNSLSLAVKINNAVIPDVFTNSYVKDDEETLKALQVAHSTTIKNAGISPTPSINPVYNSLDGISSGYLSQAVKLLGYEIDRYVSSPNGFKKDKTIHIEDVSQTRYFDTTVLYGLTYVYAVKVVASVKILTYTEDKSRVDVSTLYISSRPVSIPIECYEYKPPPEPNDIKFTFDYLRRNIIIHWDMPVNPQRDVKQFQVFRRKTIREPFELIAQFGFDLSDVGPGTSGRYKTGERVDANNLLNMNPDDLYLVKNQDPSLGNQSYPVYMYRDEDFTVDPEFFKSSEYIYAICSIDAHGMISNYSSQHHVIFDTFKNRLVTRVICDAGSPRQYPNMNLKVDAFKDVINVSGDASRKLEIYFTPEYLKVKDDNGALYQVVHGQADNQNPFYLMQFINLDNQKLQTLKINIKDPNRETTSTKNNDAVV